VRALKCAQCSGDPFAVAFREAAVGLGGPGGEVGVARLGFHTPQPGQILGVPELLSEPADSGCGRAGAQRLGDGGLAVEFRGE